MAYIIDMRSTLLTRQIYFTFIYSIYKHYETHKFQIRFYIATTHIIQISISFLIYSHKKKCRILKKRKRTPFYGVSGNVVGGKKKFHKFVDTVHIQYAKQSAIITYMHSIYIASSIPTYIQSICLCYL